MSAGSSPVTPSSIYLLSLNIMEYGVLHNEETLANWESRIPKGTNVTASINGHVVTGKLVGFSKTGDFPHHLVASIESNGIYHIVYSLGSIIYSNLAAMDTSQPPEV